MVMYMHNLDRCSGPSWLHPRKHSLLQALLPATAGSVQCIPYMCAVYRGAYLVLWAPLVLVRECNVCYVCGSG